MMLIIHFCFFPRIQRASWGALAGIGFIKYESVSIKKNGLSFSDFILYLVVACSVIFGAAAQCVLDVFILFFIRRPNG